MSGLTERFPRTQLIDTAGQLELAINSQMDLTYNKQRQLKLPEDKIRHEKYQQRFDLLDEARDLVNKARLVLWQLT